MDTRERMVEVTARLLARQGYHATGLAQVLTEAEAPRGSLYFHFPEGKEQMAAEAVRRLGEQLGGALQAKLDGKPDVRSGLQSVARMFARQLEASEFCLGCPVATTALEASDEAPALSTACAEVFERWTAVLAERLRQERPRVAGPDGALAHRGSAAPGPGAAERGAAARRRAGHRDAARGVRPALGAGPGGGSAIDCSRAPRGAGAPAAEWNEGDPLWSHGDGGPGGAGGVPT